MKPQHSLDREYKEGKAAARPPAEERVQSQAISGPGNLVWGHESCVPEGPECNTTIGSDHQVGDAAVVEGQAEPSFRGKLQCSTDNIADDIGVAYEDLIAVLLLLGISSVDVVPEGSLNPGSIFVIHSLWLPVRDRGIWFNRSTFPQQVCADSGDAWQVFTDNVCGLYSTGHGGMDNFIKL